METVEHQSFQDLHTLWNRDLSKISPSNPPKVETVQIQSMEGQYTHTKSSVSWVTLTMNVQLSPVSLMDGLFVTIFRAQLCWLSPGRLSISQETWINVKMLPCATDECPFKDHLLSRTPLTQSSVFWETWTIPLHRLPCVTDSNLPLRRPEKWMWRGFPCITNSKLCLPGDLNNEHVE